MLTAELQHRVRNILATIRAIAARTESASGSIEEFKAHFDGRIAALARAQTTLTRSPGESVDLEMLIRDELLAQAAQESQFSISGIPLRLSPKAAEVTTMAVHELATNATKYGALAQSGGHITIDWRIDPRPNDSWIFLTWTERAVLAPIKQPLRVGFGTELITRRIPYELRGTGKMEMRPAGMWAEVSFPLTSGQSIFESGLGCPR